MMRAIAMVLALAACDAGDSKGGDDTVADGDADTDSDTDTDADGDTDTDADTDTDTDTDADADSDADADADADCDGDTDFDCDTDWETASSGQTGLSPPMQIVELGWRGAAAVVPGSSYAGWEDGYVTVLGGADVCVYNWDVNSTSTASCVDGDGNACDFAFALAFTNGTMVSGTTTGCANIGQDGSDATWSYGFTQDWMDYGGYSAGPALAFDYLGTWVNVSSDVSFDSTTGDFEYDWLEGLFYY